MELITGESPIHGKRTDHLKTESGSDSDGVGAIDLIDLANLIWTLILLQRRIVGICFCMENVNAVSVLSPASWLRRNIEIRI